VWLSDQRSPEFRGRFLKHAQTNEARPLRLSLDKNAATFTFVTSGDLKADLLTIDLLLKEAGVAAFQKHTYQTHERALSSSRAEAISTLAKLQALASRRGQPSCASTS